MIVVGLRPTSNYWWKAEAPGEDLLCPWSEEEDGEEDKEQEGWGLRCGPRYSPMAAIASCWANRTPESQHGRVSIKVQIKFSPLETRNTSMATTGLKGARRCLILWSGRISRAFFFPHFCPGATASQRWCFLILVQTSLRWLLVESGTKWRGAAIVCATGLAPRAKGESSNCLKMQAFTPTRHCRQTKENKPHRRQIHRPNSEILSFFNSIGLPLHCNRFYCKDIKLQRGLSTRVLL